MSKRITRKNSENHTFLKLSIQSEKAVPFTVWYQDMSVVRSPGEGVYTNTPKTSTADNRTRIRN